MATKRVRAAKSRPRKAAAKRSFDAFPDRVDLRDWSYQPTLDPLPETLVNCARVPEILDQGMEGASELRHRGMPASSQVRVGITRCSRSLIATTTS